VAVVVGAAVADAAARPLHWIYEKSQMEKLLQENRPLEFWPESKSPFYTLPTGDRSCYNHVLMAGLEAFIEAKGEPDLEVYTKVLQKKFGVGTEWQEALQRRREAYSPDKRREWREPVPGPWLHGAVIHFLEHGKGDNDNTEMDAVLLTIPHLVFNVDRAGVVEECIKIGNLLSGQSHFVQYQSEILKFLMKNKKFEKNDIDCLDIQEKEFIENVFEDHNKEHITTVEKYGNNCHLPGSFQGSLHAFVKNGGSRSFVSTVRDVISAGGCNCSRANYAGALLGARDGVSGIPEDWLHRVTSAEEIIAMAIRASNLV